MNLQTQTMLSKANPYYPIPIKLTHSRIETEDRQLKSFAFQFVNPEDKFNFLPGQFCQLSMMGIGEAPFGIASSPDESKLLFTINRVGEFTTAIHGMSDGIILGIRGPLGNYYPIEKAKDKDIIIVGGGFAFTTLRSLFLYLTASERRNNYGKITVLYGARNPGLLLYRDEFDKWKNIPDVDFVLTIDKEAPDWKGKVGVVPAILKEINPDSSNSVAYVCGPPIMLKYIFPVFDELGFNRANVFTSLEMRMKCGIGKCGRCNIGHKYICKDGPVFSLGEYMKLPKD